jgi:hypothetical protein
MCTSDLYCSVKNLSKVALILALAGPENFARAGIHTFHTSVYDFISNRMLLRIKNNNIQLL